METRRLELRSACSCELAKQSRPLILLFKSPKPLARSRCMLQRFALHAVKNYGKFYLSRQISIRQILKFHERVISALILVASFARPKISSQFLRVNGILKFEKKIFRNLKFCFFVKGGRSLNYEVAPFPLNKSPNPDNVRCACNSALHCMRFILKMP